MQIMTPDQQCKKLAKQVAKVSAQNGAPLTLGDKGITSDTNGYFISIENNPVYLDFKESDF